MYIKIQDLIKRRGVKINGVLHLGAHQAEEALDYQKAGASRVLWIEGNPELIPGLEIELKKYDNQSVYNVLVSNLDNQEVDFNITNNLQSSSILDLGSHKDHHPDVKIHHKLSLKTHRLDTFFTKNNVLISDCNFLNIDLQGAEMLALEGLGSCLDNFDYVYTEINIGKVYKNCPLLYELDIFLHQRGFIRIETYLTPWQWGDAFYVRQDSSKLRRAWNLFSAVYFQYSFPLKKAALKQYQLSRKNISKIIKR